MTKALVFDVRGFSGEPFMPLPEGVRERIEQTKRKEDKILRSAAYSLLALIYREKYGKDLPTILYTDEGRPHFATEENCDTPPIDFSISHSGRLVAVAICEGAGVGVDVQEETLKERIERVISRFAKGNAYTEKEEGEPLECEIRYFKWNGDSAEEVAECDKIADTFAPNTDARPSEEPILRWSVLEATLKSESGFASLPDGEELYKRSEAKSLLLTVGGKKYALTVVSTPR